jgi:hypothetical protein
MSAFQFSNVTIPMDPSESDEYLTTPGSIARFAAFVAGLFCVTLAVTVALQWGARAYEAELGSINPDEAPHYINSLLIARYVTEGLGSSPMAFAKKFMAHYPKVSIGHWPPMFYVLAAGWMIAVSQTKAACIALSALITASLGTLVGTLVGGRHGWFSGLVAGLVLVLLQIIRAPTAEFMVDVTLGLAELLATLVYVYYLNRPSWRSALLFALLATGAILIKGNGLAMGLVPPLAVLFTGRFSVIRNFSFWLPALITVPICVPWYVATYALLHDGFNYPFGVAYTVMATGANGAHLIHATGIVALLLALVGFLGAFWGRDRETRWDPTIRSGLGALAIAVFLFQVIVPADVEERYMIPALAPVILLAVAGISDIADGLDGWDRATPFLIVSTVVVLVLIAIAPTVPDMLIVRQKPLTGMIGAARTIVASGQTKDPVVLIGADPRGEGEFVVEMAERDQAHNYMIARGYKLLASADFMADHYVGRFNDPSALAAELKRLGISFVVIDTDSDSLKIPHVNLLYTAAKQNRWTLAGSFPHDGIDGETLVYRLNGIRAPGVDALAAVGCAWSPPEAKPNAAGPLRSFQVSKPFNACK